MNKKYIIEWWDNSYQKWQPSAATAASYPDMKSAIKDMFNLLNLLNTHCGGYPRRYHIIEVRDAVVLDVELH